MNVKQITVLEGGIMNENLQNLIHILSELNADHEYTDSIQFLCEENESLKKELDLMSLLILILLKSKIGDFLYWADKSWFKYEKHTITDVRYEIQDTEFFGDEYVGKKCIKIYVDSDGYYLANEIGKTIFFSETEAESHTQK